MKNIRKYILVPLLSLPMLFNTGCDDYLDVNNNIDSPDYVEDYIYLSGIIQTYQDITYDLTYVFLPMTSMWTTGNGYGYASHFYPKASDTGQLIWRTVYWNQGVNLENMIKQAEEAGHWRLAGIGYAIKAFSWDILTKVYVDVPLKQAFDSERKK